MIAKLPVVKVLDGKLSKIEEIELRVMNIESIISEIKSEIIEMRNQVKDEDISRIEKLNKYQNIIDSLWLKQQPAV